jgi:hypothetical protein
VPDVSATMLWPGFRKAAIELGLHASVSVPLFAGRGDAIAALNLYGRDAAAMAPLVFGVWAVYDPDRPLPGDVPGLRALDPGAEELLTGFAEALSVRATIQVALGMLMARGHNTAESAYLQLRLQAAEAGMSLLAAANQVITDNH